MSAPSPHTFIRVVPDASTRTFTAPWTDRSGANCTQNCTHHRALATGTGRRAGGTSLRPKRGPAKSHGHLERVHLRGLQQSSLGGAPAPRLGLFPDRGSGAQGPCWPSGDYEGLAASFGAVVLPGPKFGISSSAGTRRECHNPKPDRSMVSRRPGRSSRWKLYEGDLAHLPPAVGVEQHAAQRRPLEHGLALSLRLRV